MKTANCVLFFSILILKASAQSVPLELIRGMKITSSVTIARTEYHIDADSSTQTAIVVIEGNDIEVDFSQAILRSNADQTRPDQFRGLAILIKNSTNVLLKNARIHGYRIAVRAENVTNLVIEECDFSYNFRKHLNSTRYREDISDWMSFHQNEKQEWLHYGAGIYLENCQNSVIRNCKITNGQCALLMANCNDGRIVNNNFSFNSGLGIGLYRSSNNEVIYNQLDFNIRGFSFGIYNRGQDSAGILVYEQSNKNLFAYNSATHSGDGFFLWAGQTTMDSGRGGCNDNLVFGNDFSDASNNGIEATFSRNTFINNRLERCDYGFWGGYSYNSIIGANQFKENRIALAIEHGQYNHILYNQFRGDQIAIKLWANRDEPKEWGYAKVRDTRSTNYFIVHNTFSEIQKAFELSRCDSIFIDDNAFHNVKETYRPENTSRVINFMNTVDSVKEGEAERLKKAFEPEGNSSLPEVSRYEGRHNIMISEWGPYDFRRPILWLDSISESGKMHFRIAGPQGKWRMKKMQGAKLSGMNGLVPDTVSAVAVEGFSNDIKIDLEYFGEGVITEFGEVVEARQPFVFSYRKFEMPLQWKIDYYLMDTFNPAKYPGVFKNAVKKGPIKTDSVSGLEFTWWNAPAKNLQEDHFALIAAASQNFQKGNYTFGITADDGVRFYLDDKLVMEEWNGMKYQHNDELHHEVTLPLDGKHNLRIEYYDQTGLATLMLTIQKE